MVDTNVITLALSKQVGVGPIQAKKIWNLFREDIHEILEFENKNFLVKDEMEIRLPKGLKLGLKALFPQVFEQLELAEKNAVTIINIGESVYPVKLKYCADAPLNLFVKGRVEALNQRHNIAVVGTRRATSYGKDMANKFVGRFASVPSCIISGLAHGIDTAAHKSALENKLVTGAVLGHGFHLMYPSANKKLAAEIVHQGGFLLSEYWFNSPTDPKNFTRRNRIVAGMSDAILVVETGVKGGSMVTASYAQQYNRDVYCVPGRIGDTLSEGCHELIKHQLAYLVTSPDQIINDLGWSSKANSSQGAQTTLLIENRFQDVYGQLEKPVGIDELCLRMNKRQSEVNALLTEMELDGLVRILPGKRVERV
ncbi:DNA-processing protein DprA [Luteibaculum oceani]|uniref:DNA-protecting protein DprA n=1 Tax=Luteibaculum oceani TaxID=1294296 RepID=A0A5C6V0B5_9FLAO|nr:DNA-processing protein DprA [Luteibaculum oceani]TXC78947.1 DNA-protecting protein DprA [Luteibaculum oceani]